MSEPAPSFRADLAQAEQFLSALDASAKRFTFQTFDDSPAKRPELVRVLHGSLREHATSLELLNRAGAGVFVTISETDLKGRKYRNIKRPRAVWHECDEGADNLAFTFLPSIEVESSPGKRHSYWLVNGLTRDQHAAVMATMVRQYQSDPKAADLARVLRVPGFWHMKGRPHMVRLLSTVGADTFGPYTTDELFRAFPPAEIARTIATRSNGAVIGDADNDWSIGRATDYLRQAAPAIEGEGGDARTIAVANRAMDFGVSPDMATSLMLEHWNPRCEPEWDDDELAYKVSSAARSRQTPIGREIADDAFAGIEGLPPEPVVPRKLLLFPGELSVDALIADRQRDLVRGLLGRVGFGVLYGDSGAGKSFLALDLAYHLARAAMWHGRKTMQTAVLYVCAEGLAGFQSRVLAAQKEIGDAGHWFAMLAINVTLARESKDLKPADAANSPGARGARDVLAAAGELRALTGADNVLIVFDTLARVTAGNDENKVEDMMHFVEQRCAQIQREAGAAVLIVHHTNKAGNIRGSSALYAAADLVLRAEHDKAKGTRQLIAEKVKDGREGPLAHYALRDVPLGVMPDTGEPFSSCVVELVAAPSPRECAGVAREILGAAMAAGENLSPSNRAPNFAGQYCVDHQPDGSTFSKSDFAGAIASLEASGFLGREDYIQGGKNCVRYKFAADDAFT